MIYGAFTNNPLNGSIHVRTLATIRRYGPGMSSSTETVTEISPRVHFTSLDGLRGVAAIAVALGHLRTTLHGALQLPNTALAVDFFFMLSGFVIAHAYGEKIQRQGVGVYLAARVIRLYPMILLGAALGLAYYYASQSSPEMPLFAYGYRGALLVPTLGFNGIDPSFLPLDPPAWSLFFEMVASVLFGLGLWRGSDRSVLLLVLIAGAFLAYAVSQSGSFDRGWSADTMAFGLARVFFGFGAGVLLYRMHCSGRAPKLPGSFLANAMVLGIVLISPAMSFALQIAADFLLFPVVLLSAARHTEAQGTVCRTLGELSYPLYIVHWPVFLWVGIIVGISWWTPFVAVAGALLTAHVALKVYDEPSRKWMSRWLRSAVATSLDRPAVPLVSSSSTKTRAF